MKKNKEQLVVIEEKNNLPTEIPQTSKKSKNLLFDSNNSEENVLKRKSHKGLVALAIASIIIILIILVAALLEIYQACESVNLYLAITVIVAICVLLFIFVVWPIIVAMSTPCFTLDIIDSDAQTVSRKNYRKLQRVAKNIIKTNDNVSLESKLKIKEAMNDRKKLNDTLKDIYDHEINKDINKLIRRTSTEVLVATAISQNNKFDAATTIILNIRLIMKIVVRCGYHPSYPQLSRLIIKVMRNALIAYTIQSLNLEDIIVFGLNKLVKGALTAIPGLNEITKSVTQGAANALLTLRIGILTRKYLYEEYNIQALITDPDEENSQILTSAVKEANDNIDGIIDDVKKNRKSKATV
ncbi:MAG: DUF697 domain-containing protein [Bacilli bacterium]